MAAAASTARISWIACSGRPAIHSSRSCLPRSAPGALYDVIQQNARDGWDGKTQREARSISSLFMKFMLQDLHVDDLNALDQHYVGNFVD